MIEIGNFLIKWTAVEVLLHAVGPIRVIIFFLILLFCNLQTSSNQWKLAHGCSDILFNNCVCITNHNFSKVFLILIGFAKKFKYIQWSSHNVCCISIYERFNNIFKIKIVFSQYKWALSYCRLNNIMASSIY